MKFLLAILIDVIVGMALLFGALHSDERLLNIGYFAGWFVGIVNLVGLISPSCQVKFEQDYEHRSLLIRCYDVLTDLAFIVFSVWSGWFVMAAVYALQSACKAQMIAKQERKLSEPVVSE